MSFRHTWNCPITVNEEHKKWGENKGEINS
jgi:hypothetical protein